MEHYHRSPFLSSLKSATQIQRLDSDSCCHMFQFENFCWLISEQVKIYQRARWIGHPQDFFVLKKEQSKNVATLSQCPRTHLVSIFSSFLFAEDGLRVVVNSRVEIVVFRSCFFLASSDSNTSKKNACFWRFTVSVN